MHIILLINKNRGAYLRLLQNLKWSSLRQKLTARNDFAVVLDMPSKNWIDYKHNASIDKQKNRHFVKGIILSK